MDSEIAFISLLQNEKPSISRNRIDAFRQFLD